MERKIKLIWDFKGAVASKTAEHHVIHLKEYVAIEQLDISLLGTEDLGEFHSIAFMVVNDEQLKTVRDPLKPHRATLYE